MLPFKPHRFLVNKPVERQRADGVLLPHAQAAERWVDGQITPEKASVVFEKFGVELANPFMALADDTDADAFETGGEVLWDGMKLAIRAVQKFGGVADLDHVEVALERLEHADA